MTKELLEKNYIYITNKLFDDYPGLRKVLRYFEFPGGVKSCLGITGTWDQDDVINLFYNFTISLPNNVAVDKVVDVIAQKFTIIMSWDELVDRLIGGLKPGLSLMTFAFGPNERVRLHEAYLAETSTRVILTFCGTSLPHDKVQVTLQLLTNSEDIVNSWKDMPVGIQVRNLEKPVAEMDNITMSSFRLKHLADLINKIYR